MRIQNDMCLCIYDTCVYIYIITVYIYIHICIYVYLNLFDRRFTHRHECRSPKRKKKHTIYEAMNADLLGLG